ncbi:outer membrane protein transport protein [bacterium]|nr:outer membrane protein transport protein [bacterium]
MISKKFIAIFALLLLPSLALATNGYFSHGVGMKSKAMGGAGLALAQDAMAGGNNPAGFAFIERRVDLGVDWFRPDRGSAITGNAFGVDGDYDANDTASFFMPEFGIAWPMSDVMSLGLSVYGNGGMNTSYTTPIGLFGTTNAGVNLSQLFIAPTFAFEFMPGNAIGVTFNYAWQSFEATGLQNFAAASMDGDNLTDNDASTSTGFGFRVGYMGQLSEALSLGAAYQGKTNMSEFDEYAGLFAEAGDFDIPSSYAAGFAYNAGAATVAFDWAHINYSEVASIANPMSKMFEGQPLGGDEGPGFGWEDMDVFKLGLIVPATETLDLRAGFNHGAQPIPAGETLFNILAPGVVESHYTFGGTWTTPKGCELTFGVMYAPEVTVEGENSIPPGNPPGMGGGEADLHMSQMTIGLSYAKPF